MLVLLNVPLIGIWVKLLTIPYKYLYPSALFFVCIGVYAANNDMWNGYDCREVTSAGAQKCGIEKTRNKMVGRGVFLDVARHKGVDSLDDGYGITNDDLYSTAKKQKTELKRGDYVIVRTGMRP